MLMNPYKTEFEKIKRKIKKEEKGAVMILMAFLIIALLGFCALALDVGLIYMTKSRLQQAVDAAARAGSMVYEDPDLTPAQRTTLYRATVNRYMEMNGFNPDTLDTYDAVPDESGRGIRVKAVCIVPMNFARILGYDEVKVACKTLAKTDLQEETHRTVTVDVAFVLDLSGSMFNDGTKRDNKFIPMIDAVNTSIDIIKTENAANRIGINVFGDDNIAGSRKVTDLKASLRTVSKRNIDGVEYRYQKASAKKGYPYIYLGRYSYKDGEGMNIVVDGYDDYVHLQRSTATFTQYGIQMAGEMLENSDDDGVTRIPSVFLMSDGECTYGYNDNSNLGYKNIPVNYRNGAISHNVGWGNASRKNSNQGMFEYSNELSAVGLYTIEAATYWKNRLASIYTSRNSESTLCRFFCLGYKLDDTVDMQFAQAILNPATLQTVNASDVNNYFQVPGVRTYKTWERYWNGSRVVEGWVEHRENVTIYVPKPALMLKQKLTNKFVATDWEWTGHANDFVNYNDYPTNYQYADWYQEAADGNELKDALKEFANQVIIDARKFRTYLVE